MDDQGTTDLDALTAIIGALKTLKKEDQQRTLRAVATFLGLEVLASQNAAPAVYRNDAPSVASVGVATSSSFSEDRKISPKDFLRDKKPYSDVDRVACLAYYLTHYRETPHFKTVDISALNTEAAQPKFSNASMAVDNATKAGLLVQAIKGAKQLSSAGEHYVQNLPDRDAARESLKASNLRRKVRRPPSKKAPRKKPAPPSSEA